MLPLPFGALVALCLVSLGETTTNIDVTFGDAETSWISIEATSTTTSAMDQAITSGEACKQGESSPCAAVLPPGISGAPVRASIQFLTPGTLYTITVDGLSGNANTEDGTDTGSTINACTLYDTSGAEATNVTFDEDDETLASVTFSPAFTQEATKYVVNYETGGTAQPAVEGTSLPVEITVEPAKVYSFTISAQLEGCAAPQGSSGTIELAATANYLCSEWYGAVLTDEVEDCVDDERDDTLQNCTGSFTFSDGDTSYFSGFTGTDFDVELYDATDIEFTSVTVSCSVVSDTDTSIECEYTATGVVKETEYTAYAVWNSANCGAFSFELEGFSGSGALMAQATFLAMMLSSVSTMIF